MSTEARHQRNEFRFDALGLGLSRPTDQPGPDGHFPILVNVRSVVQGTLRQRPGMNTLFTAAVNTTPSHSIRRLNDKFANDYTYVAGVGTTLQYGKTPGPLTSIDTGWSGLPMSMVPFQPIQAYNEWMAVADKNKMRKVKYDGTLRQLGISAPVTPPEVELDPFNIPLRLDVDTGANYAGYAHTTLSGTGGGIAGASVTAVNATITYPEKYAGQDPFWGTTAPGWFAQPLNTVADIVPGTVLTASGNSAKLYVEEVHPGAVATTTVERIIDDDSTISLADEFVTIVPATSLTEFQQHAVVRIVGVNTQNAAIVNVIPGPDGRIAFRCYASFGINVGDTITILPSVFGWLTASPTGTMQALGSKWLALRANDKNYLIRSGLTLDLSKFSTGGRAVNMEKDEMNINMFASDPSNIDEIKIQLHMDATINENFYEHAIRPNDLLDVAKNKVTAANNRANENRKRIHDRSDVPPENRRTFSKPANDIGKPDRDRERELDRRAGQAGETPVVGGPGDPGSQTPATNNQWFPVRFKLSELVKFGTDPAKTNSNIVSLRIIVATNSTGTVDFAFDDWWIGGGYEPDVSNGAPYEYRYRYRDSSTGARSNWSPQSRNLVKPHRHQVYLTTTGNGTTGVDYVDIQRRGGSVNDWRIIATVASTGASTFYDIYDDKHALFVGADPNALEGNVNARPFTIRTGPLAIASGLTVSGNLVYDPSARFNLLLAQGTELTVNGLPTLVYRAQSTSVLELYDHCGSSSNASLNIPDQEIVDQPLPHLIGIMDGWTFALGDAYNPGRLYFFNQWSMDGTTASHWLDVSDSSNALLNGCVYNGRLYIWTAERMYVISYSSDVDIFRSDVVSGGVGMYGRWATSVGDSMYWLGRDGIYASDGGNTYNIVRRDLLPLFGNEGQAGVDTNTISSPHMPQNATEAQIADLRLTYAHDKYLYFDYKNAAGARKTLVLERGAGEDAQWGWFADVYSAGNGAVMHYSDEGEGVRNIIIGAADTTTSKFYTLGGSTKTDAGSSFGCQVRSLAIDGGDIRADKQFGDGFTDVDPGNTTITPTFWFDNFTTSIVGSTITGASRVNPPTLVDFNSGSGLYGRNIAIDLTWTVSSDTHAAILYAWGFSFLARPEETIKRATDFSDLGHWGPKELKGISIEADTEGAAKTVLIEYTKEDGTVATISKTVNTGQKDIEHLTFDPVICYEARIRPTDTNRWKYFEVVKWHFEPLTDLSPLVGDWFHFGHAVWVQGVEIDGDTNNAVISCPVQRDFSEVVRTISAQHNGRGTKAYAFDPPFIAYMVRTAPAGAFRRMRENWRFKPEAPIGTVWETQEFELGSPYGFARELEFEYASGATVTIKYWVDGILAHTNSTTLITTGGLESFRKLSLMLPAVKGRLGKFRAECSTGVRVRENGTLLSRKSYGGGELSWVPVVGSQHGAGGDI